jgi:hypothetical protein
MGARGAQRVVGDIALEDQLREISHKRHSAAKPQPNVAANDANNANGARTI